MNRPLASIIVAFILLIGWNEAIRGDSFLAEILYLILGCFILYTLALVIDAIFDIILRYVKRIKQ